MEKKKHKNKLFKEYFINYQNPSDMYKKLCKTEGTRNENRVYLIKEMLNKMKKVIKNVPINQTFKIEENEKIINIAERILYFNQLDQEGKGLKILTPNQMLSRLPIFLAQLKAGNNFEMKLGRSCILCANQRNLQKMFIKVWLTLFKYGNNLYEHWK